MTLRAGAWITLLARTVKDPSDDDWSPQCGVGRGAMIDASDSMEFMLLREQTEVYTILPMTNGIERYARASPMLQTSE